MSHTIVYPAPAAASVTKATSNITRCAFLCRQENDTQPAWEHFVAVLQAGWYVLKILSAKRH